MNLDERFGIESSGLIKVDDPFTDAIFLRLVDSFKTLQEGYT